MWLNIKHWKTNIMGFMLKFNARLCLRFKENKTNIFFTITFYSTHELIHLICFF